MGAGNTCMAGQRQLEASPRQAPSTATTKGFDDRAIASKSLWTVVTSWSISSTECPLLRLVNEFQIRAGAEVAFLQAHQYHAGDGVRLQSLLNDLLPIRQALTVENIDRLAAIIKSCQQNSAVKHCGLKVRGSTEEGGVARLFPLQNHRHSLATTDAGADQGPLSIRRFSS